MVLPVVLTPGAATGIGGIDGQQLAIASRDEDLAAAAIDLLSDARRGRMMGLAARRFVCEEKSWQAALAPLADILGWTTRATRHAA